MTADLLRIAIATSIVLAAAAIYPRAASGQDQPPPAIGPFVVDVRGTSPNFPDDALLAESRGLSVDELPGRGLGFDAGAHLYLFKWRVITFAGSRADDLRDGGIGRRGAGRRGDRPRGHVWFSLVHAPAVVQLRERRRLELHQRRHRHERVVDGARHAQQPLPADEERLTTINYGAGARWFAKPHVAFTFDVRFSRDPIPARRRALPGSPRMNMLIIGAGVSIK